MHEVKQERGNQTQELHPGCIVNEGVEAFIFSSRSFTAAGASDGRFECQRKVSSHSNHRRGGEYKALKLKLLRSKPDPHVSITVALETFEKYI